MPDRMVLARHTIFDEPWKMARDQANVGQEKAPALDLAGEPLHLVLVVGVRASVPHASKHLLIDCRC